MADQPKPAAPVSYTPVARPMTEREIARERLRASVDALAHEANLQVQLQREPLKMLGGASAVGAVIGLVVGRQFKRSKKIYVDAGSPTKHQKALIKAQQKQGGKGVGGALVATLGTLAVRTLTERVITPKLEEIAHSMQQKASQPKTSTPRSGPQGRTHGTTARPVPGSVEANTLAASTAMTATPAAAAVTTNTGTARAADAFLKPAPVHPGVVPQPESQVEAKVAGSEIALDERANPNLR
ncbi:hypothetical protein [Deinococcus navajonensis]|uniref:DUF3618 domain-containing protein n=1 Tax=Deinococcus navajonensis TaxID=309884 RepID=A0ABV8XMA3_9DEIO